MGFLFLLEGWVGQLTQNRAWFGQSILRQLAI